MTHRQKRKTTLPRASQNWSGSLLRNPGVEGEAPSLSEMVSAKSPATVRDRWIRSVHLSIPQGLSHGLPHL